VGAWRQGGWKNWALYGLGIGLGILTKGPAILIYLLPVALLAPLWMGARYSGGWGRWYRNTGLALLAGIALALCWAIPAVIHGGDQYREMILWGQTAGRMVQFRPCTGLVVVPAHSAAVAAAMDAVVAAMAWAACAAC
jgi:4-amino-4-deoxy-L-arabinose transferase-like glycosyltransferase